MARIDLAEIRRMASARDPIAMLTAYDHGVAQLAAAAGVHALLVGDSVANVVLGAASTRAAPLEFMLTLAAAVRAGAPDVFLVGDLPFEVMASDATVVAAARRFVRAAGCDAVKIEVDARDAHYVAALRSAGICTIAHLGLRPQQVRSPDGYRAQARDAESLRALVAAAREMTAAGADLLLLEAVPSEAAAAVVAATDVPVIGCGAGPACHGHVVVTNDMLGQTVGKLPRFVPVLANVRGEMERGLRAYVAAVTSGAYPAAQHAYSMRTPSSSTQS